MKNMLDVNPLSARCGVYSTWKNVLRKWNHKWVKLKS